MYKNEISGIRKTKDYLKYYRIVTTYYRLKHNLEPSDLDMLFFLWSEPYFTHEDFREYEQIMPWNRYRFSQLRKAGYIEKIRDNIGSQRAIYRMSRKGINVVTQIYKTLEGEVDISLHRAKNPMVRVNNSYRDKVFINGIKLMRRKINSIRNSKNEEEEPTDPTEQQ